MGLIERLPASLQKQIKTELVKRYFGNTVAFEVNVEGDRRIRAARRSARGQTFDASLRKIYGRDWATRLPGIRLEPDLFESVRKRAVAALNDPTLSPCCFNSGDQAQRQGIPQALIKHDYRRATVDVRAVIPDAVDLIDERLVQAIRSAIGSNFTLDGVYLKRNYHVEPELRAKYDLLSDRWHFDHQYPDGFSLFVALDAFRDEHGPTQWIDRPDSLRMLRLGFDADERIRSRSGGLPDGTIEACPSYDRLVGPAGSLLLIHTSFCLHASGVPASPDLHRDTLCFTFRPSSALQVTWM